MTDDLSRRIIELWKVGLPTSAIAREVGLSKGTTARRLATAVWASADLDLIYRLAHSHGAIKPKSSACVTMASITAASQELILLAGRWAKGDMRTRVSPVTRLADLLALSRTTAVSWVSLLQHYGILPLLPIPGIPAVPNMMGRPVWRDGAWYVTISDRLSGWYPYALIDPRRDGQEAPHPALIGMLVAPADIPDMSSVPVMPEELRSLATEQAERHYGKRDSHHYKKRGRPRSLRSTGPSRSIGSTGSPRRTGEKKQKNVIVGHTVKDSSRCSKRSSPVPPPTPPKERQVFSRQAAGGVGRYASVFTPPPAMADVTRAEDGDYAITEMAARKLMASRSLHPAYWRPAGRPISPDLWMHTITHALGLHALHAPTWGVLADPTMLTTPIRFQIVKINE